MPFVDILVLNYNSWRHTIECLESVARLDYPDYRVLVCDNGSTDGSLDHIRNWLTGAAEAAPEPDASQMIRDLVVPGVAKPVAFAESDGEAPVPPEAKVVLLDLRRNGGFAAGNNAGMRFSRRDGRAELIWLLNNDTVVAPDALRELVATIAADERMGAVGGSMLEYRRPEIVQFGSGAYVQLSTGAVVRVNQGGVERASIDPSSSDFNFICGGCFLIRAEVIDAVGMLDERFFIYAEDSDLSLRVLQAGWRIGYAAKAYVWHKGGGTTVNGSPFNDYHNIRSSLLLVHKWRRGRVPLALAYWLYRAVAPKIVRRQWHRLPAVARAYRDALRYIRSA